MVDATIPESFIPRTTEEISTDIQNSITGVETTGLSGFFTRSFDRIYIDTYAEVIREQEIIALAALLSGWVDYCDGVDEAKMERLGLDDAPI